MDSRITPPPASASTDGASPKGSTHSGQRRYGSIRFTAAGMQESDLAENSSAGKRENSPLYYRGLFSLAIMGVFGLWLLPLYRLSAAADHTQLLRLLMLSAAALLAWGCLLLPRLVQASGQFLLIFMTWYGLCAGAGGGGGWLKVYAMEKSGQDALLLLSGRISALSEDSRLLILVLGWGLLVSSVQQLALYRGSIALFTGVTLVYLLVLDMGYAVNTSGDVLVTAGLILWLRALSGLLHLQERTERPVLPYARWGARAFSAAVLVTLAAWMAGQGLGARPAAPVTLQPVLDKLEHWAAAQRPEEAGVPGTGSTGYSMEDRELGMPLTPSREAAFTVTASRPYYSRGESMAYYDGRRWIRSGAAYSALNLPRLPGALPALADAELAGGQTFIQRIQLASPSTGSMPLFSAGAITDVQNIRLADGSQLGYVLASPDRLSFRLPEVYSSAGVTEYTVKSVLPPSDPVALRKLKGSDPEGVRSQYLQLPAALPPRVRALAGDLTAAAASRYDAAVAVAGYLQDGYTYSLKTRVPPSGADFTDDFLFGTRQGYCVHFATAMTVLLRSSGIPARYVQGYGPGTAVPGSMPQRYSVTGGDAHAWVEVYFPGAGWVPFDPTPSAAAAAALGAAATDPAAASVPPDPRRSAALHAAALTAALPPAGGPDTAPLALAALVLAAAIRWRRSLALLPAVRRAGRLGREPQLRAAAAAWHGLAARYGPPLPGVTAREYADSLAIEDGRLRAAVRGFVRQWETLAYGGAGGGVPLAATGPAGGAAPLSATGPAGDGVPLPSAGSAGDAVPLSHSARMSPALPKSPTAPSTASASQRCAPASAADTMDAEAFIARCLMITFHLT
ncbi:transglutaminase-like domain-containing protein [Paenibacillus sp. FSL H3-0333]|uniref:transglutaminase-like domain-containing protein n=1 Tax=Paenibacillus sp. FSL H3-0333 TaxID=2921373 RepID=UPI0030F86565